MFNLKGWENYSGHLFFKINLEIGVINYLLRVFLLKDQCKFMERNINQSYISAYSKKLSDKLIHGFFAKKQTISVKPKVCMTNIFNGSEKKGLKNGNTIIKLKCNFCECTLIKKKILKFFHKFECFFYF